MSIRLIALDLDGTLLNSKKELTERNKKALEDCIAREIYIVPCTGRTSMGIPEFVRTIPGVRYAITVNGGMIEDMKENKVLDEHLLKKETALELIDLVKDRHVMYDAYIGGQGISEDKFYNHLDEYHVTPEIQLLVKKTRIMVPNIVEYVKKWDGMIDKVNYFFDDLEERQEIWNLLKQRDDILVSTSLYNNLEINGPGASKGEGLLRLAAMLGIKQEETMAFGDGNNDVSMIRDAGIGAVMANGDPGLKEIANYITATNDESGVAQAIEKLVLSGENK